MGWRRRLVERVVASPSKRRALVRLRRHVPAVVEGARLVRHRHAVPPTDQPVVVLVPEEATAVPISNLK